jgi:CheY-like chemotaxis protein
MGVLRPRGTVLIVDDDPDIRESMSFVLEAAEYQVRTAANGDEALACLRKHPLPSVILLDLMMPVMNGWQFRNEQAADPRLAEIPVIVLTGAGNAAEKAASLGVSHSIEKPVELEALFALIRRLC